MKKKVVALFRKRGIERDPQKNLTKLGGERLLNGR